MPGTRCLGGISLVPKAGRGGEGVTAEKRREGKARERKGTEGNGREKPTS